MGAIAWLLSLLPGAVTGQLRPRARRVARRWMRHNATWRSLRYWPPRSWLFWGGAHPIQFVICVAAAVFGIAYVLGMPHFGRGALIGPSAIDGKYDLAPFVGVPWSIQATVVSLVYPIVLSYIGLLLQRRVTSSALQHVYQLDSAVVPAGSSSLALLLVMSAEYFLAAYLPADARTKYLTTLLVGNWGWLAFNLCLTGYFVSRTVRFLRDGAQDLAFTRVAVSVVLKQELELATQQHLLVNAPEADWKLGDVGEDKLPRVLTFAVGGGSPAVVRHLSGNYVLHDVHSKLLAFVARRWSGRAARAEGHANPRICFPALVGEASPATAVLCTVEGGPALTEFECALVEAAFVFRRRRSDAPELSSRSMLEELAFEARTAADARQFDAARDALRRLIRLHDTLLLASVASEAGSAHSVAAMSTSPYGWGSSTFGNEWLRAYRELAATAARLTDDDRRMLERVASVPAHIADIRPPLPEQPVLDGMQVGSAVAHDLGAWWTRKADESIANPSATFQGRLPPPAGKAYEHALTTFIGAWGRLTVDTLEKGSDEQVWDSLRARTTIYARHIDLGAQFFLKAIARGDEAGAEWFLESFIKWWGNRQHELDSHAILNDYQVRHVALSLSTRSWNEAQDFLRIDEAAVTLETAAAAINLGLRRYWESMRVYLAVLLVHYAGEAPKPGCMELRLAAVLVKGRAQKRGGTVACDDLTSMDEMLAAALRLLFDAESPIGRINSFAENLRWDSEAPEVSGWIYGWSGTPTNLLSMQSDFVTLLLALQPPRVPKLTSSRRLVESWWREMDKLSMVAGRFAELRRLVLAGGHTAREPVVLALHGELETTARVRTSRRILAKVFSSLEATALHERRMTLRSLKVDDAKVKAFTAAVSAMAFASDAWPSSKGIALRFVPGLVAPAQHLNIEDYKARYLERLADDVDTGMVKSASDHVREFALALPLAQRLRAAGTTPANAAALRKNHDASDEDAQAFLLCIAERCAAIRNGGEVPAVIVGRATVASYLNHYKWGNGSWQYAPPPGVTIEASDAPSVVCKINGVAVRRFPTPQEDCFVVPAALIATLEVSGSSPSTVLSAQWELKSDERVALTLSWAGKFS